MNQTHYENGSSKKDSLDVTHGEIQKKHLHDSDSRRKPSSLTHTRSFTLLCSFTWQHDLLVVFTLVSVDSRTRTSPILDRHWFGNASELPQHGFNPRVDLSLSEVGTKSGHHDLGRGTDYEHDTLQTGVPSCSGSSSASGAVHLPSCETTSVVSCTVSLRSTCGSPDPRRLRMGPYSAINSLRK